MEGRRLAWFYARRMRIKSLGELRGVDELSARFTPWGLSTTRVMTPEAAARSHQESISSADLIADVPDDTARAFERLREIHSYGIFLYDLYSCVEQLQPFVLEHALSERFVTYYDGDIPFMAKDGAPTPLKVTNFDQVYDAVARGGGSHTKTRWLAVGQTKLNFRANLRDLITWSRLAGLLRGERNRFREHVWVEIRNHFAHPSGHNVSGPAHSARAICRLGETINHLWGSETPDGELYPSPYVRTVLAIGWTKDEAVIETLPAGQLAEQKEKEGWEYIILRGYRQDGELPNFDTRFEVTNLPAELLWGPGPLEEAVMWLEKSNPANDLVGFLDRSFAIRVDGKRCDRPRLVEVAAGLTGDERSGVWHLVKADFPGDAVGHTRSLLEDGTKCAAVPEGCPQCAATTLTRGTLEEILAYYVARFGELRPKVPPTVRTPGRW